MSLCRKVSTPAKSTCHSWWYHPSGNGTVSSSVIYVHPVCCDSVWFLTGGHIERCLWWAALFLGTSLRDDSLLRDIYLRYWLSHWTPQLQPLRTIKNASQGATFTKHHWTALLGRCFQGPFPIAWHCSSLLTHGFFKQIAADIVESVLRSSFKHGANQSPDLTGSWAGGSGGEPQRASAEQRAGGSKGLYPRRGSSVLRHIGSGAKSQDFQEESVPE